MSASKAYFIGVEGGASNVFAAVYNNSGVCLGKSNGKGCNPWVSGVEVAAANVVGATKAAAAAASLPWTTVQKLPCSLCTSGSEAAEMRDSLTAALRAAGLSGPLSIHNDAVAPAFDGLPAGAAIVIAGTGSIAQVITPSGQTRAGGWGHMFGDDGSGYDIAQRTLRAAVLLRDGQPAWRAALPLETVFPGPAAAHCLGVSREHGMGAVDGVSASRVWARATEHFTASSEHDLLPHFHSSFDKAAVAAFTTAIAEEATAGDRLSQLAFAFAGRQLASAVAAAVLRHGVANLPIGVDAETGERYLPLVCVGSVFKSFPLLRRDMIIGLRQTLSCLAEVVSEIRLLRPAGDATRGAAFLAATSAKQEMRMTDAGHALLATVHLVPEVEAGAVDWDKEARPDNLKRYVVGAAVGAAAVAAAVGIAFNRR